MTVLIVLLAVAVVVTAVPALRRTRSDSRSLAAFSRTCSALSTAHADAPAARAHIRVVSTGPQSYYRTRPGHGRLPRLSAPNPSPTTVIVVGRRQRANLTVVATTSHHSGGRKPDGEPASAAGAKAGGI